MKEIILCKYGELVLKGANKSSFESRLTKELRRRAEKSFLLLTGCDGENALPAFDDYGHGALLADGDLQYAEKPAEAIDEAIRRMKQLVPVL